MNRNRRHTGILWVLSILIFAAMAAFAIYGPGAAGAGVGIAAFPFLLGRLMDGEPEGGGGGGMPTMTNQEFQAKTLAAVGKVRETQESLVQRFDNLDKETKKTFEDITKVKNDFQGFDSQVKELQNAIKKLNLQLTLEARMANHGTAMSLGQRIARNKEHAKGLFAHIAKLVNMPDAAQRALGEDTSPGSTLINDDLYAEVYDSLLRYGAWSTLGVRPVGTKNTKIPVKTARPTANFILTEGGTISDDTDKAGTTVTLEVEVIAVLLHVSLQLIEDGEIDIVADVLDDFIEAVNYRADFASFQGAGTANGTHGGVTGLFGFGTAVTAAATRTTIAATKYDDWLKCLTGVDAAVLQRAARWWIHPTLAAAAIGVQDLNGRPIFQTAMEAPGGGILNLFGFPVTLVGAAPSTNAASAKVAAFGDPRAYAVGMRKQFTFEASDHFRWNTLERSFRGHCRFDGVGAKASALTVLGLPAS